MAGKNSRKITKYPQNINNINIGMVFFVAVAIYILISVILYLKRDHIIVYQVMEGALSTNNSYKAIALRSEKIVTAENAGYVYYFAPEGRRVAVNSQVYTVDESGQLLEYLKSQGAEEVALTDESMEEVRSQIVDFSASFDEKNFYTVYDFKSLLDGTVQKLSNESVLQNIESLNSSSSTRQSIKNSTAQTTGIVVYSIDGYENLTLDAMSADKFDESKYEKHQLINNTLVKAGDPVYKVCDNEEWSVVIQVKDEEQAKALEAEQYVKVKFIKNQDESMGKVSWFTNADGDTFVQLSFTNSMITFCRDRFLDIELITKDDTGLKIPNSSIVEKSFFIVPEDFVTINPEKNAEVLRDKYDEQGNKTSERIVLSIYGESDDETEYYIDTDVLRAGDVLIKQDSTELYTVSKMHTLLGVYNINKGYADFKQIEVLYQNDEYSIVKSYTNYGLNVYDYIVLDAEAVDKDAAKNSQGNAGSSSTGNSITNETADEPQEVYEDSAESEASVIDEAETGSSEANASEGETTGEQ